MSITRIDEGNFGQVVESPKYGEGMGRSIRIPLTFSEVSIAELISTTVRRNHNKGKVKLASLYSNHCHFTPLYSTLT